MKKTGKSIAVIMALIFLAISMMPVTAIRAGYSEQVDGSIPVCGSPKFHDETVKLAELYGHAESMNLPMPIKAPKSDVVGDINTFWCYNFSTDSDYQISATCQRVGTHCYVYVENGEVVSDAALDDIVDEFDNNIYSTDTSTFGSEWNPGIDGDSRITILILDIQDDYPPYYTAGYFWSRDEYTAVPGTWTEHSNEREMFYMDLNPGNPGSIEFFGTLAHEFQHMIHWYHDVDEETWVDEGCADYASFVCGYDHPMSHVNAFENYPDVSLTRWDGTLQDYGASYTFTLYQSEKYGDLSGASGREHYIRDIVNEGDNGIQGINDVLTAYGYAERFVDLFKTWTKANYLDDPSVNTLYGYHNLDLQVFPEYEYEEAADGLPFTIDNTNVNRNSWMGRWATDYVTIQMSGATPGYKITFDGLDTTTTYEVSLAKKAAGVITQQDFVLDANKDGTMPLPYDASYTDIVLIIRNSGDTDTTDPSWGVIIEEASEGEIAIMEGLKWLRTTQNPDGSWQNSVGITSMSALAFLNAGYTEDDSAVNEAIQYILANRNADGSFGGTYETSLAVLALVATHNASYNDEIADAMDWLVDAQYDEGEGADPTDACYGGWRYGSSPGDGDLSNTQFALMALCAAELPSGSNTWTKAITFTSRCQNRPASNDQAWAHDNTRPSYNDGGFIYVPSGWSLAGGTKSYGSMTAAGIWSLRLCGVDVTDPQGRVQAGLTWLTNNEDCSFDGNPGMGADYQYYYYMSIAKALAMCFLNDLGGVDWYAALSTKLADLQHDDGCWSHYFDDETTTDFALLALQTRQPPPANLWMSIILASNAELCVYDPQGRHACLGDVTIPGATFEIDAEGRQIVNLRELEAGKYRIVLKGTADGDYSLTIAGYRDDEQTSSETFECTIEEGEYQKSDVLITSMVGALTIYAEEPEPLLVPDLVIEKKWMCWPDTCTICYNVTNIGEGTAPACHNTALYVDSVEVAHDHVPVPLAPGESYIGCFDDYAWTYTPPSDNITVCADNSETLDELDETNNCLTNIWMCGDVNCDGKVTMSDVRKVFNRYLDPNYPLDSPWSADVNCDGKVTMSDVRKVFNRYLDPGYDLNCCCE